MLLVKDIIYIIWKVFVRTKFPAHHASLIVLVLSVCATIYGVYQGVRVPDVKEYEFRIENLGQDLDGMKIAMLVDIHSSSLNQHEFVKSVVNRTNSLNPDLILIPGDFVDGKVENRSKDLTPLNELTAKFGVYGTTGNHEYYYDYENWMKFLPENGVRILENEHVVIESGDSKLIIAGIPDPTGGRMGLTPPNLSLALKDSPNAPVILMDHQPGAARNNSKHNITLQLSGHTHGGQMPGIYQFVKRANGGFVRGWYDVDGMKLYVSPGTSQWDGFIIRLFDHSEITLFTLRTK